jgi:hypothetical protein
MGYIYDALADDRKVNPGERVHLTHYCPILRMAGGAVRCSNMEQTLFCRHPEANGGYGWLFFGEGTKEEFRPSDPTS